MFGNCKETGLYFQKISVFVNGVFEVAYHESDTIFILDTLIKIISINFYHDIGYRYGSPYHFQVKKFIFENLIPIDTTCQEEFDDKIIQRSWHLDQYHEISTFKGLAIPRSSVKLTKGTHCGLVSTFVFSHITWYNVDISWYKYQIRDERPRKSQKMRFYENWNFLKM